MITLRKNILKSLSEQYPFELKSSWEDLPENIRSFILYGNSVQEYELKLQVGRGKKQVFPGVFDDLKQTILNTSSDSLRAKLHMCQHGTICPDCNGGRLSSFSRNVKLAGMSLDIFSGQTYKGRLEIYKRGCI